MPSSSTIALNAFLENRNLKRPKLGPPDVYPQEPKQKEDELTSVNVKQGFIDHPAISDEHSSAHLYTIDANKISQSFNTILTQKQICNTFNDDGKKRPQVFKENFFVTTSPSHLQSWFKELGGNQSLRYLSRKVPGMNKKEDIFQILAEYDVPLVRAAWFIKMTAMYYLIQTEVKSKKRPNNDPNLVYSDWTQAICKFMREQLAKLNKDNSSVLNGSAFANGFGNTGLSKTLGTVQGVLGSQTVLTRDDLEKQLKYISNLAHHMYTEGLFDRHEFLTWVVETFEAIPMYDEIALSYFMPFVLQYIEEVSMNLLLSRRMSFAAAHHLNWIFMDGKSSRSGTPTTPSGRNTPANQPNNQLPMNNLNPTEAQLKQSFPSYLEPIVHTLGCIIQVTALTCTGALVWYPPGDSKICGSPLDLLPCPPSSLLLPEVAKEDTDAVELDLATRAAMKEREAEIIRRSSAAEMHWSSDKCQESTAGHTINRVLISLEALDKQNFDRGDPLDSLYHKIFDQINAKDHNEMQMTKACEQAVIGLLCEWAITAKRLGEHRAAVVAKLLDLRQAHYEQTTDDGTADISQNSLNVSNPNQADTTAPVEPVQTTQTSANTTPYFQNLLVSFLDSQAPELKDPEDTKQLQAFKNLVLLFTELIEHGVFSHLQYINILISRGDITPDQITSLPVYKVNSPQNDDMNLSSNKPTSVLGKHMDPRMEVDEEDPSSVRSMHDVKMEVNDMEFLQATESVFSPDSRADRHFLDAVKTERQGDAATRHKGGTSQMRGARMVQGAIWGYNHPRHVQYVTHFPIPFQEDGVQHEWNQRLMVLYGAGRQKSEVKQAVKKVNRHLMKLVQNKRDLEDKSEESTPNTTWAPPNKKSRRSTKSSHSELLSRFRALSYFDQNMVTSNAGKTLMQVLNNYISGRNVLPRLDVVTLLFDLMEEALNVGDLVRLAVSISQILAPLLAKTHRRIKEVDAHGNHPNISHKWYSTELALKVVAVLRHYQSYLTLNADLALDAFDGLLAVAKRTCISNPAQCTSADRSILVFLYDLYNSFSYIKLQHMESFSSYSGVVKQALCSTKKPSTSNCRYDPSFLLQFIENPSVESALSVAERFSNRLHDMTFRYSFVCSAVITVCNGQQDFEKVNALAALCVEMNTRCSELSAEWLGVLKALCCSSCTANFNDVLMSVEASDSQIRDPLALLTAVLIARGCLSLEDVIQHVAIPSLLAACNNKSGAGLSNPNTGARLTCHLLLQLFKTPSSSTGSNAFRLPTSADRHLLAAAQRNIAVGAVLAVLKAVLKLGDAGLSGGKSSYQNDDSVSRFFAPIQGFDNFDDIQMPGQAPEHGGRMGGGGSAMDEASLSEFAKHAVHIICSQQWVRERCLKDPVMDLLLDKVLTQKQRQNLIQLICYPDEDLQRLSSLSGDPHNYVVSILSSMTRWTMRQCLLELQVMLQQSPQEKSLPEHIAKATIEVFQRQQQQQLMESARERKSSLTGAELDRCNVWLVAPLVGKLPSQVQGRVLQEASTILEAPQNWSTSSTRSGASVRAERHDHKQTCSLLLNHQPFLTLILTCLKGQDDQRDSLLDSLQSQIIMLHTEWQSAHTQRDGGKETPYLSTSQGVHEALQLRLSLVGGMFDTVQSNAQWTSNVVVLLTQLINSGMVDVQVNAELFDIVFDMIAILLHHTLGGDGSNRGEVTKREYIKIVSKMKKEMGRQSESIRRLRHLLPIPKAEVYVVCCEPSGPLLDVRGNKVPVPVDSTQGLQVASKQKLNAWDIIEGLKQPAPLCLAWFGARKMERKAPKYEVEHALMLHHQHNKRDWRREFLVPPKLPPEEEEEEVIQPPAKIPERKPSKTSFPGTSSGDPMRKKPKRRPVSQTSKTKITKSPLPFRPNLPINTGGNISQPAMHSTHGPSQQHSGNYQNYNITNQAQYNFPPTQSASTNQASNFTSTSGFPPTQQHLPPNKGNTRQHLASWIRARQPSVPQVRFQSVSANQSNAYPDVRQKIVGMSQKSGQMSHDMFPPQQRQAINMPQQMLNQSGSFNNYNNAAGGSMQQQTQQHGMMNYNNGAVYRNTGGAGSSGQMGGYQQLTGGGASVNQQYTGPPQQQPQQGGSNFVSNMPMGGSQTSRNFNQRQNVGMMVMQGQNQPQQQNQYNINQIPNRGAHMTRINPQSNQMSGGMAANRMHTISGGGGMQTGGGMGQQPMIGQQHQTMINQQPQYNQQMQQGTPMMEMRRNVHQQGPPPQY
uniref:Mediator of RNA polymerase II transcription subunit 12-like protein n=1 Tax=Phallusia mammillata TaxID=59560 RepID=A0A6F9DL81_9ASCI|nr:mediator of RNA polymerase II transcription subunit 12-like protein [Phallusia mammillata]